MPGIKVAEVCSHPSWRVYHSNTVSSCRLGDKLEGFLVAEFKISGRSYKDCRQDDRLRAPTDPYFVMVRSIGFSEGQASTDPICYLERLRAPAGRFFSPTRVLNRHLFFLGVPAGPYRGEARVWSSHGYGT